MENPKENKGLNLNLNNENNSDAISKAGDKFNKDLEGTKKKLLATTKAGVISKESINQKENQNKGFNKGKNSKSGLKLINTGELLYDRMLKAVWILFIAAALGAGLLFLFGAVGFFGKLPSVEQLENPELSLATEIISDDGQVIGKYFRRNRSNIEFEELSPYLVNALVSTEDYRFYDHSGIDYLGLMRAVFFLGKRGGASTITQQLAKNLFTNVDRSNPVKRILQKVKEWIIAVKLERRYTKNEIITMYFNTMGLSQNTFGIKSAARTYFNKPVIELNVQESATLIGMLQAPTYYNPLRHPERSKGRRNIVIGQMVAFGGFDKVEADSIKKVDLVLDYNKTYDHNEGLAPYFREYLRGWLGNWCKENKKLDGSNYDIYEDGLKVYTTLNATMQYYAEQALISTVENRQRYFYDYWKDMELHPWHEEENYIENSMTRTERYKRGKKSKKKKSHEELIAEFDKPVKMKIFTLNGPVDTVMKPIDSLAHYKYILNAGFMAMEPGTGHIKAWVGGINHHYFKYDNVKPTTRKQVGSTFKPFIYAMAIQNGWSPCQKVPNMPVTFDKYDNYTPENVGTYRDGEMISLKEGLGRSMNRITAYLMKELNPQQTRAGYKGMVRFFNRMGIKSDMVPVPSMCLGVADLSIFEMVGAYGTFANKGVWVEPTFITKIEDKNGNVVTEFIPEQVEALDQFSNAGMLELLQFVVKGGTARRLTYEPYNFSHQLAGKTGTTQDNSDGWFMGVTPKLVCGTWVGGDDKFITIKDTKLWSGASLGIPIFGDFMQFVYADESLGISKKDTFYKPLKMTVELDCDLYNRSSTGINSTYAPTNIDEQLPGQPQLTEGMTIDEQGNIRNKYGQIVQKANQDQNIQQDAIENQKRDELGNLLDEEGNIIGTNADSQKPLSMEEIYRRQQKMILQQQMQGKKSINDDNWYDDEFDD